MQSFNNWLKGKEEINESVLYEEGKKAAKKPAKKKPIAKKKPAKKKEWKTGKKLGIKGTVKAALDHHPDKFGKGPGKLNPYAIFTAKAKKGMKTKYKNQASTLKGTPQKKAKFKEWMQVREEKEWGIKDQNDATEKKYGKLRDMKKDLKAIAKKDQETTKNKA